MASLRVRSAVVAGVALVALVGVGAFRLVQAASALRSAERAVDAAEAALEAGQLGPARGALAQAGEHVARANEALQASISLDLLGALPVVDQNLSTLAGSVELVATVVHGGERILAAAAPLESGDGTLQVSLSDGSVPVRSIEEALVEVRALRTVLPVTESLRLSPLVLPPVREAHDEVRAEVLERRRSLDRLDRGLTLLQQLVGAERPTRHLIAVANSAEMRGTGGMVLNYGVLEGRDGTVDLVDFGRVGDLPIRVPVEPDVVDLPEDVRRRWDGFAVTQEWRNATVMADFTSAAPVLEAMYQRATGYPVDGVIQVDPRALASLLAVVGPVDVPEIGTVTSTNVEAFVLHEAYRRFPGVEERSDVLGDVAEATFRRLVDGDFPSVSDLAGAIVDAVDGRHLIAHSGDVDAQEAVRWFGAAGELPPADALDAVHVTVQNVGGNKLDWYLDTAVRVSGRRPATSIGRLRVEVDLRNGAPVGETAPRYIFGPNDGSGAAGTYRGVVSVYLPAGTALAAAAGGPFRVAPTMQTEGGRPVVSAWVDVPAGGTRTIGLDLALAPAGRGTYRMVLVPSPRVRPTTASIDVETEAGARRAEVVLDRTWVLGPPGPTSPSAGAAPVRAWHER